MSCWIFSHYFSSKYFDWRKAKTFFFQWCLSVHFTSNKVQAKSKQYCCIRWDPSLHSPLQGIWQEDFFPFKIWNTHFWNRRANSNCNFCWEEISSGSNMVLILYGASLSALPAAFLPDWFSGVAGGLGCRRRSSPSGSSRVTGASVRV